jgi:hypothetical protein
LKKVFSVLTLVVLLMVGMSSPTSAAGTFTEYYSMDYVTVYSPSGYADVQIQNYSEEGGNFHFVIYEAGTEKVLYEVTSYIPGKTAAGPATQNYTWITKTNSRVNTDMAIFRDNESVEPTFFVDGQ